MARPGSLRYSRTPSGCRPSPVPAHGARATTQTAGGFAVSNDSMGNLEKLGILVIVILVVVVGVVAITPEQTLFPEPDLQDTALRDADLTGPIEPLPPLDPVTGGDATSAGAGGAGSIPAPIWPDPLPVPGPDSSGVATGTGTGTGTGTLGAATAGSGTSLNARPAPDSGTGAAPVVPAPVIEPAPVVTLRDYTVKSGDSFYRIAERELGDVSRAKEIQAANPSVDPRGLRIGQVLRLPTGGGAASTAGSTAGTASTGGGTTAAATGRTYVVKAGDTPMEISSALYGTVRHWKVLLERNGISDPSGLRVGAVLQVPDISSDAAPPARGTEVAPGPSRSAGGSGGSGTYDVRPGDTLMGIASSELGSAGRWREILELNGLDSPADLRAGSRIRLPAR